MKFSKLFCALTCCLFSIPVFGSTSPKEKNYHFQEWKDLALQRCLSKNYESINAFHPKLAKDMSFWTYNIAKDEQWTPNSLTALDNWVDEFTSSYSTTPIPVKADSIEKPVNAIFAKCMAFYKSKELGSFLKKMLAAEQLR